MRNIYVSLALLFCLVTLRVSAQTSDSLTSGVRAWKDLTWKTQAGQTVAAVMNGSTTSLRAFTVFAVKLAPSQKFSGIGEDQKAEQLIIMKEGRLNVSLEANSKTLERGGIAYIMAGDPYTIVAEGSEPVTFYVLIYKSKKSEDLQRGKTSGGSFALAWDKVPYTKNEKGARKNFFNRSTSQIAKFEMHTTALNAGLESHAPHTHKEEEIILILRGNVKMHIAGKLEPAVPGDVVFLSSGVSHALLNTGNEQAEYFAFQWSN